MNRGDIVTCDGTWYVVVQVNSDDSTLLLDKDDTVLIVQSDDPKYKVEFNPFEQWPFIVLPHRSYKWGDLTSVAHPTNLLETPVPLRIFQDWLLGEPERSGGTLYLNPKLRLRHLDRIVLTYTRGSTSVIVPKNFRNVSIRAASSRFGRVKVAEVKTVFDHLLKDDEDT
jgi:hypothetical protein